MTCRPGPSRCIALTALIMIGGPPVWSAEVMSSGAKPFSYQPKGHRDPFIPLVLNGKMVGGGLLGGSRPTLNGILWDPRGQSIAMINDTEMKVGDAIGEYHVKEIRRDAVILQSGVDTITLQISFETTPSSHPKKPRPMKGSTTGGAAH